MLLLLILFAIILYVQKDTELDSESFLVSFAISFGIVLIISMLMTAVMSGDQERPSYEPMKVTTAQHEIAIQYERGDTIGTQLIDQNGFHVRDGIKFHRIDFDSDYSEIVWNDTENSVIITKKRYYVMRPENSLWNLFALTKRTFTTYSVPVYMPRIQLE